MIFQLWLDRPAPEIGEAREAASCIVKDVMRASDIINRIGSLFKKGPQQHESVDINQLILEMIELLRGEEALAERGHPEVGDRVLQRRSARTTRRRPCRRHRDQRC